MVLPYFKEQSVKTKPDMWLCKPDRTAIFKLKDIYDVNEKMQFSAINELSFTIPALVERNHQLVQNPLVDKIKERFLIRVNRDNQTEYFIVMKINKQMNNDGFEEIAYQCFSIGIQIAQKLVRDYEETSKTLSFLAKDILSQSTWKLDYVDVEFDLKYRSFETSSSNALQCIFDLAERFNAGITFNTNQRKLSFHQPKNIGRNKGFKFKEGFYLESFGLSIDPMSMVTRMECYGQDGLEFRRLSPTGSNYIEDYSFFMFPFECDANYKVIKPSNWMSDSLCIALRKYQDKLTSVQGQFNTLTTQATSLRDSIQQKEQELSVLKAKDTDLKNQRDVINYTYGENAPTRPDWQTKIAEINANQALIDAKNAEITGLKTQLDGVNNQIQTLRDFVKVENNFTPEQILEWEDYIIVQEYYNDSIVDEKDLLEESINVFEDVRQPPIELTLSLDDFMNTVESNFHQDRKIELGDIIMLKSKDLNVDVRAKIVEISKNYESNTMSITVSNTVRQNDDYTDLMDKINLSANTSTTVNIDKYKWNTAENTKNELTNYINGELDSAKQLIVGGMNNSVQLNERGLIARDMTDPDKNWLMIQNGQFFITADGGNSVEVAINKNGIFANKLFGKVVLGNKLQIEDDLGIVVIESGAVKTYDTSRNLKTVTGRYQNPDNPSQWKYGLRIYDGSLDIRTSESTNRGTQFDENGIRTFNNNGVRTLDVDANSGLVSIIGSLNIKTSVDSNRGVTIDGSGIKGYNNSGQLKFEINTNTGDAMFAGRLQSATGSLSQVTGTVNNLGGTFAGTLNGVDGNFTGSLTAATGTFNGLVTGTLSSTTVSAINIDAQQITTGKLEANRINATTLSAISADLGTITAGTINAVTINSATIKSANIDISESIKIGQAVTFSDLTSITTGGGNITIEAFNNLFYSALKHSFNGTVDFTGATVIGL